jgi:hypothetical protein
MSKPQTNLSIAAPGFEGINTELSQTTLPDTFAREASNCIIDSYGRMGARKGLTNTTTDNTDLLTRIPSNVYQFLGEDGVVREFLTAGDGIFEQTAGTLDNITPTGDAITDDNWQMLTLNDQCFFIQGAHKPLVYTRIGDTIIENTTTMPEAYCGTAAFGRLWLANTDSDNHQVVYWSNRIEGTNFTTGDADSINVELYWPTGYDTITALAAHNGRLIVFGEDNILVYAQADGDPSAAKAAGGMYLEDQIKGIGCVSRDSVQNIGTDVLFLDSTGVRSLSRTIQENSAPIGEISANISRSISQRITSNFSTLDRVRSVFIPEERLYLMMGLNSVLAFDTTKVDERGAMRVTTWDNTTIKGGSYLQGSVIFADSTGYITTYGGYQDNGNAYRIKYRTNFLSFGDSSIVKIPKSLDLTFIAAATSEYTVSWATDYSLSPKTKQVMLTSTADVVEYGGGDAWGVGEFGGGEVTLRKKTQLTGSGTTVQVGIEADINGTAFSIQEINIKAIIGRLI